METWRSIPGFEGIYEVSDCGRVRSLSRTVEIRHPAKTYLRSRKGRELDQSIMPYGYRVVGLLGKTYLVHRLVAETFIGPCPAGHEVTHKNGEHADNRLENLRHMTHKANCQERVIHKRQARGEWSGAAKLTERQVRYILEHPKIPVSEIMREFNIKERTVYHVKRRESWKHVEL